MKNNKKNVIWFSEIRWDYMVTRKQHLIKRLSNNYNFIFIEPYKKNEKYYLYRKEKNIIIITIPTFKLGNKLLTIIFSFSLLRYLIYIFQYILLKTVIRKDISLQIISNPCFIQLCSKNIPTVWDYNDYPFQFAKSPAWLKRSFNTFLNTKINCIWASSKTIFDNLKSKKYSNVEYIPNGVDTNIFKKPKLTKKDKIKIGYVGIISSWFFDFDLLRKISKAFPHTQIDIVGPLDPLLNKNNINFSNYKNIKLYGKVKYSILPEIISSFDVGIIPLKQDNDVYKLNSAKFLQYYASKIKIVSVPFLEFDDFKNNVYFCKNSIEFINSIKIIIENKCNKKYDPRKIEKFCWDKISLKATKSMENIIGI